MKKKEILKKNSDFNRLINSLKPIKSNHFIVYLEENNYELYQFGFSVGKKVGGAVIRNKVKRQLKSIVDKNNYRNGFICIIMVKKNILNINYQEMNDELNGILKELNLTKESKND